MAKGLQDIWVMILSMDICMQITKSYFITGMSRIPQPGGYAIKFPDGEGYLMPFNSVQNLEYYLYSWYTILQK